MPTYYFQKALTNRYLGETKLIKAKSEWELSYKEQDVYDKWAKKEANQREKDKIIDLKSKADKMDRETKGLINDYDEILKYTLKVDDKLNWESQLQKAPYADFVYQLQPPTLEWSLNSLHVPKKSFLETIFSFMRKKREALEMQANENYQAQLRNYNEAKNYEYQKYMIGKTNYEKSQEEHNNSILKWRKDFEDGETEAIEKYINVVLEKSKYPYNFNKEFDVQYLFNNDSAIISYTLPNIEQVPAIAGYKYVATSKTIKPIEIKKKDMDLFYEKIIQQIALRTIHEVFESIYTGKVNMIVFNGWVHGIDRSTGNEFTSCIISIQVIRKDFSSYNLLEVDPKLCIRQLRGLTAGPLAAMAPIKPFMDINREDKRFIESKEVLANFNSIDNLATMDWADFEHLIRELFSKIFTKDGAEVKVTQASRDGGVDAIAFDPDPIRGGKFVIQAKRYNITVPVSAVRDLYGTMINEGASKGILVTTSYYSNDSREFAKDKPITLIDGQNLAYMFREHGYDVKIELQK